MPFEIEISIENENLSVTHRTEPKDDRHAATQIQIDRQRYSDEETVRQIPFLPLNLSRHLFLPHLLPAVYLGELQPRSPVGLRFNITFNLARNQFHFHPQDPSIKRKEE